jgi:hypothetical protein
MPSFFMVLQSYTMSESSMTIALLDHANSLFYETVATSKVTC